jgi:hypothetical protein
VDALLKLETDVVLVERSAPRYTRDLLLEAGVALVTGVDPETLRRVARCTGGEVAASVEVLGPQSVGVCERFSLEQPPRAVGLPQTAEAEPDIDHGDGSDADTSERPLMVFSGCPRPVGATVVLRGGDSAELRAAKRAVTFGAYAAHWNRIEACLLSHELALACAATGADFKSMPLDMGAGTIAMASAATVAAGRGDDALSSASPHISVFRPDLTRRKQCSPSLELAEHRGIGAVPVLRADARGATVTVAGAEHATPPPLIRHHREGSIEPGIVESRRAGSPGSKDSDSSDDDAEVDNPGSSILRLQQLWLAIACRNPAKGVLCEAPHTHAMEFYRGSGTLLRI